MFKESSALCKRSDRAGGRTPLRAIIEMSSSQSSAEVTPSGTNGALGLSLPTFTEDSVAIRRDFLRNSYGFAEVVSKSASSPRCFSFSANRWKNVIASSMTARLSALIKSSSVMAKSNWARAAASLILASRKRVRLFSHQEDDPWQYKYPKASPFKRPGGIYGSPFFRNR